MEENQSTTLFGLGIDPASKTHLAEAAKWARFLAIVGFVMIGLLVLAGIFAGSIFAFMGSRMAPADSPLGPGAMAGMGGVFTVIYILIALIYFFPCLFLYRFATKAKAALTSNDQEALNTSFQNLKIMFRYVGIITIIVIALYLIIFLFAGLAAGFSR